VRGRDDGRGGDGPLTEQSDTAVARLDGIDGTRADAPVARLGAELPERPVHASADLTGLAGPAASDEGAARVADLGGGRDGAPEGEPGSTSSGTSPDAASDGAPPAKVIALFDTEGLAAHPGDTRVARLSGAESGRRRITPRHGGERRDGDGRARRRRGGRGRPQGPENRVPEPEAAGTGHAAPPVDDAPDADARRSERGSGRQRSAAGRGELDPDADPVAVAREICLRLLTDRARTRKELAEALRRRGVPDDAATTVLERFDEVGLIDDAAFAGQWVRSRHAHRGLARRAIAVELRRKGVSDEDAGEALAELDVESEERRARELVDRKLRSLTVATADQRASAARRLVGMLARKGYGAGVAYRVVREALAERGAEADELGDGEPPDD
jgi:regulatory protein